MYETWIISHTSTRIEASLPCKTDQDCQDAYQRPETTCLRNVNVCSNPFQQGCLTTLLPNQYPNGRICNSDDIRYLGESHGDGSVPPCRSATFKYPEIRISNGNWESNIFQAWIFQIILMEILEVPVTAGLMPNVTLASSFYDPQNRLTYSDLGYPFVALRKAHEVGDCLLTTDHCADLMPEVWSGQADAWTKGLKEGYLLPTEGDGQVGKVSWFIPAFTARQDPTLVSFYGLRGDENRHKLANTFLRPVTWREFCEQVSMTNCSKSDDTAVKYPESNAEETRYYVEGLYTGHFRATEKNNCTLHPTTCTGAIIGPSCDWSTNIEAQVYWNNISLEPDGPIEPNGAYTYDSMIEIWRAANATRSNVLMWWWTPDALGNEFQGTPGEMQQILLPTATDACARARVTVEQRCSVNRTVRLGSPEGACDLESNAAQKVFARSLRERTYRIDAASRSPGYDYINNFKITDLQMNDMLRTWLYKTVDKQGNGARETVCSWVVQNLDYVLEVIPQGYPRELSHESSYHIWFLTLAVAVAITASLAVMTAGAVSFHYRKTRVFVFAQFHFVVLILFGSFMICVGAIVTALEPTSATCTSAMWLVVLGYSIELVPVLVKTAAINRILQSARKLRRVRISPASMIIKVVLVVVMVTGFLLAWTIVDQPDRTEVRVLANDGLDASTSNIVKSSLRCASDSYYWYYFSLAWQALLLLVASVLAFLSRKVVQDFNESQSLGFMVYSHFLFMVLRAVLAFMGQSNTLKPNVVAALLSYDYSFDSLIALFIYLVPKLKQAILWSDESTRRKRRSVSFFCSKELIDIETRAAAAAAARSNKPSSSFRGFLSDSSKPMRSSTLHVEIAKSECSSGTAASSFYARSLSKPVRPFAFASSLPSNLHEAFPSVPIIQKRRSKSAPPIFSRSDRCSGSEEDGTR